MVLAPTSYNNYQKPGTIYNDNTLLLIIIVIIALLIVASILGYQLREYKESSDKANKEV